MLHPGNWFRRRLTAEINSHYAPIIADLYQRLTSVVDLNRLRMNGQNERISNLESRLQRLEKRVRDANYFGR